MAFAHTSACFWKVAAVAAVADVAALAYWVEGDKMAIHIFLASNAVQI